ncbi:MAG: sulfurtransferase [Bacteroidota bacterium]
MKDTLISSAELQALLGQPEVVIVDCRFSLADKEGGRKSYLQAHIPGAFYAHLDDDLSGAIIPGETGRHPLPSVEQASALFSSWGIGENTQVIAYDQGHGGIAARLWWMLNWLGHEAVAVLNGGWPAWEAAGGPTEKEVPTKVQGNFMPTAQDELWIGPEEVEQLIEQADSLLIDSRAAARYRGEVEPIDPIAGHIATAVSAPFADNMSEGQFKSREALKERFNALLGDHPAGEAVFYCGSGVTACHNLFSMKHAGLGLGKLYPGSWSEWITRPSGKKVLPPDAD